VVGCVVGCPPDFTLSAVFQGKGSETEEVQKTQQKRP
jgi:hypothetical protein